MNEERPIEVIDASVIGQLTRAELSQQIEIAKRFPRSIKQFQRDALELATLTERVAEECIYALPRAGKTIEGESARFAEILLSSWTNCTAAARIVGEDAEFVTAQGVFYDLQRNVRVGFEVRRRITDKNGNRYSADIIQQTANAAASIALRNATLRGIPKALWADVSDEVRRVILGDAKTLSTRRADAMAHLLKRGATEAMVLAKLGRPSIEEVTLDDLLLLRGIATAIKEGDTTVEQAFAVEGGELVASKDTLALNAAVASKAQPEPSVSTSASAFVAPEAAKADAPEAKPEPATSDAPFTAADLIRRTRGIAMGPGDGAADALDAIEDLANSIGNDNEKTSVRESVATAREILNLTTGAA